MIDAEGYRANVGIVICNRDSQVLWARRIGQNSWQFPQGGINPGESPEEAMYRELGEELGLSKNDVTILAVSRNWLRYRLPQRLIHWEEKPVCVGQRQKWFLLRINEEHEKKIEFNHYSVPEFDGWRWVTYWYPIRQVVPFKRDVYRRVLKEFAHQAIPVGLLDSFTERKSRYPRRETHKRFRR